MEKSFEFVDVHSVVWQCIGDSLTAAPSTAVRPMILPTGSLESGGRSPLQILAGRPYLITGAY